MTKKIINIKDGLSKNMKDHLSIGESTLRGSVDVYEKRSDGQLNLVDQKNNLIVFGGRTWLLQRAFGSIVAGGEPSLYNKTIMWFACGQGGGEPGNPLQAGATIGSDTKLLSQIRLRSDLTDGDPGYPLYASDLETGDHGYFKRFSSVTIKEDHSNPYIENSITKYPPLIAEIRIELSSDDANGDSWVDLNEAGLFIADQNDPDPGKSFSTGGHHLGNINIRAISKDGDYAICILDSENLSSVLPEVQIGDYMYITGSTQPNNNITKNSKTLIVDKYNGETGRSAYVVIENPACVDEDPATGVANFIKKEINPYIMFSRVTFSSIRKTQDRELVFIWKIYF